jgi:hypothetical protein
MRTALLTGSQPVAAGRHCDFLHAGRGAATAGLAYKAMLRLRRCTPRRAGWLCNDELGYILPADDLSIRRILRAGTL